MNPRFDWLQRAKYIHKTTGYDIQEEQTEINLDPNRIMVATTIFPLTHLKRFGEEQILVPMTEEVTVEDSKGNKEKVIVNLYDAFFYYNVNPTSLQNKTQNSSAIVIPQ